MAREGPQRAVLESYLDDAIADLEMAELGAKAGNRHAAYHLEHRGLLPSKSHHLDELIEGNPRGGEPRPLPPDDPWRDRLLSLTWLSEFATTFRYPTPSGKRKPGPATASVLAEADRLRELIEAARADMFGA